MITYLESIVFGQPAGKRQDGRKSFRVRSFFHIFLLAFGLCQPLATQGIVAPAQRTLPNLDKRMEIKTGSGHLTTAQGQAIRQLKLRVSTAQVDEDSILGTPKYVRATSGFLTGPRGEGGAQE